MWTAIGVPYETVVRDPRGQYTLDVADVPATPNDDWMPPMNTIKWKVEFYYTYARSGVDYWIQKAGAGPRMPSTSPTLPFS